MNQKDQKDGALNMNVLGVGLKSLKREEKASLSLTKMEPMVKQIKFSLLSSNLMLRLEEKTLQSHSNFVMLPCISKSPLAIGGQV